MRCPSCNHDNRADRRFCTECGAVLSVACSSCGAPTEAGEKFCGGCGERLPTTAPAPVAPPPTPEPGAALPAEERRHLTVLFCDLVGSTEIAARLDPEDWHRISKEYQQAAAAAVARFGGHVDKFLGDGLVCFFGVPQAHEDDAERAVRAGLAIVDAVQGLNAKGADPAVRLRVRVGTHTGAAVVGHGGGESNDVFGDTPNVAARVQSAAEPDTVVITAGTQRLVAGLFVVEERGAQPLKGVPEPVVLYRVVQPSGVRSRLDLPAGLHTPFVGRQSELGVLADAWERAVDGMGQKVLVQGEAGIGKSRLCCQLREQLAAQPHTWLECRCSPYTAGTPFRPVIELVEQALAFQPTDTPAEKLAKLAAGLTRGGFTEDETVALLAEWLELPERAGYSSLSISPDLKRRKTLDTLAAWHLKLAELQPMLVLVEDLHWCDPSSLELLGRLGAQSATARVLLVGTARREFASPWPARSNLQTLTLGRLTKRQTREMIIALSAAQALPEAVVEQLVTRADGVPLFAEELTQAVLEAGSDAAVAEIPVTLQDSLLARLDRLSSAKEVAQRAAVVGREFSYELLAAIVGMDAGALQQGLARLVEAELVFVRGEPPDATYTFKHALVQEAAYESLLKRTRLQLHGCVAQVLEAEFPERASAEPERVAAHYEAAGLLDRAVLRYRQAGLAARARSAHHEAARYFRKAITLLESLPEARRSEVDEMALQLALGSALIAIRGYGHEESRVAFARASTLCERHGTLSERADALVGLAICLLNSGALAEGLAAATEVLAIGQQLNDERLLLMAHEQLATIQHYQGKFAQSLSHAEAGIALYDPARPQTFANVGADNLGVSTRESAAVSLWYLGYPDRAVQQARAAFELARRSDDRFSLTAARWIEGWIHALRGEPALQRTCADEVVALSEANGFPVWLGVGKMLRGSATAAAGDPEAGLADFTQGLEQAMATGSRIGASLMLGAQAEIYIALARFEDATSVIDMAFAMIAGTGETLNDSNLLRMRGESSLMQSRLQHDGSSQKTESDAEDSFHRALDIARAQDAKSLELRAASSLARLWRDQAKCVAARDLLTPLCGWFTEGFDTRDLKDAKALLDELA